MSNWTARAVGMVCVLWTFGVAKAQDIPAELGVDEPQLTAGDTATVTYDNPNMGGETVEVKIDNGSILNPQEETIEIQLDEDGRGTGSWPVPEGWRVANFNAPEAQEESRLVTSNSEHTLARADQSRSRASISRIALSAASNRAARRARIA